MLLYIDFLRRNLLSRDKCVHGGYRLSNPEADTGQLQILTWFQSDFRRDPVGESASADGDMIGDSRTEMVEYKKAVIVRHDARVIVERRGVKNDVSAGNRIVIHVDYRAGNGTGLRFGGGELLCNRSHSYRHTENEGTNAELDTHLTCPVMHETLSTIVADVWL